MVSPIDYTMDVLSPIEGYMDGLTIRCKDIQTGRLNHANVRPTAKRAASKRNLRLRSKIGKPLVPMPLGKGRKRKHPKRLLLI
jgi:hypothetical protein